MSEHFLFDLGDAEIQDVYPRMVKEIKSLMKPIYYPIQQVNKGAVVEIVTNLDLSCIWDPAILEEDQDDNDVNDEPDVRVQEEEGMPDAPSWLDVFSEFGHSTR